MSYDISNVILCAQDLQLIEEVLSDNQDNTSSVSDDARTQDRQRYLISRYVNGHQTKEQLDTALKVYDALNAETDPIPEPRSEWPDEHHATSLLLNAEEKYQAFLSNV